jgi:hypothetical protein
MTSFSTYASKFLSSGAATASVQQQFANQSRSNRPFGASNYPAAFESEGQEADDDVFGIEASPPSRRNRHHLPHLADKKGDSSRQISRKQQHIGSISDIDDEDEEEEADRGRGYHNERSHVAMPSGSSVLGAETKSSKGGVYRDAHDPFLAEDDLQHAGSMTSASSNHTRHYRGPSSEAKARGWMAHIADSSSNASTASYIATKSNRDLPHDIYRDPDEDDDDDDDEILQSLRRPDKGKRTSKRDAKRDRYSIYDDVDSSASTSTLDSDESNVHEGQRRKKWRKTRRTHQKAQISKAAGSIGSSLREPLLSSAGSDHLSKPPGAFRGQTSRIASTDIYAYPHPPAKAGWTPWAPGNRVSWSEYKDKVALVLWAGLCFGTLATAIWMVLGAKSISAPSSPSTRPSPYYTLTRSVPILFLLTFLSISAAAANLFFLRNITKLGGGHVLRSSLIGVPLVLAVGWMWAFAGSFIYDDERWSGGGWSTTG